MSGSQVPRVQTLCTPAELYAALRDSWTRLIADSRPTRASLLVLLSQWAEETGWGRACWNWNLGNAKHVDGDGHDFYYVRCSEIIGRKEVWFDPPHPACAFVAFPSLQSGADYYLTGLKGRFRAAWPAVIAGDPAMFAHLLKLARYYTADEGLYTNALKRCYQQLDGTIPPEEPDAQDVARAALDEATVEIDLTRETDPPPA